MSEKEFLEKLQSTLNTYKGATDGKTLRMENIAVKALVSQFGINESLKAVESDEVLSKYLSNFVTSSAFSADTKAEEKEVKTEEKAEAETKEEEKEEEEMDLDSLFKEFKKHHKEAQLKRGKICFSGYRFFYNENKFVLEDVTAGEKIPFSEQPTLQEILSFFSPKKSVKEPAETERKDIQESPLEASRKKVLDLLEKGEAGTKVILENLVKKDRRKAKEFVQKLTAKEIDQQEFENEIRNICDGRYDNDDAEKKSKKQEQEERESPYAFPKFSTVGQLIGAEIEVDGKMKPAVPFLAQWLLAFEGRIQDDLKKLVDGDIELMDMLQPYKEGEQPEKATLDVESLPNSSELARKLTTLCRYLIRFAPQDVVYRVDTNLEVGDTMHLLACSQEKEKSKPTAVVEDEIGLGMLVAEKYGIIFKTDVFYKHENPTKTTKENNE